MALGAPDILLTAGIELDKNQVARQVSAINTIQRNVSGFSNSRPLGTISRDFNQFDKSLEASTSRVLAFGLSAGAILGVQRAFSSLVRETIEVDKQLRTINVVLGLSRKNMTAFGAELFSIARNTGQSFKVVADAAVELARQGVGVEETLKRTRDGLVLTRLSGLEAKASVEALTAAINSFTKSSLDSTQVINKLANVDQQFAVSSKDLAEGIKRVGSVAEDAGVNIDELIGLITAARQITSRNGGVIAQAIQSVFARISRPGIIEDLRELGVEINGTQTGVEKLKALSRAIEEAGPAQSAIIKDVAGGVRNLNILSAVLKDVNNEYGLFANATKTAAGASNEALIRNEQLNKSYETLVNRTATNLRQIGASIGNITVGPVLEKVLGGLNVGLEGIISKDSESAGEILGKGLVKGLGEFLSGPALVTIGYAITKLLARFAGEAATGFKTILGLNAAAKERLAIEFDIAKKLEAQPALLNRAISSEQGRLQVVRQINSELIAQQRNMAAIAKESGLIAAGIIGLRGGKTAGIVPPAKAVGHIPEIQEKMGAYAGGYRPGQVREMTIPSYGRVIYNTAEKVRYFPGLSQPAIIPPLSSKAGVSYKQRFEVAHGFDPYKAGGLVPNFAAFSPQSFLKSTNRFDKALGLPSMLPAGASGVFNREHNFISLEQNPKFSTAVHELSHATFFNNKDEMFDLLRKYLSKTNKEQFREVLRRSKYVLGENSLFNSQSYKSERNGFNILDNLVSGKIKITGGGFNGLKYLLENKKDDNTFKLLTGFDEVLARIVAPSVAGPSAQEQLSVLRRKREESTGRFFIDQTNTHIKPGLNRALIPEYLSMLGGGDRFKGARTIEKLQSNREGILEAVKGFYPNVISSSGFNPYKNEGYVPNYGKFPISPIRNINTGAPTNRFRIGEDDINGTFLLFEKEQKNLRLLNMNVAKSLRGRGTGYVLFNQLKDYARTMNVPIVSESLVAQSRKNLKGLDRSERLYSLFPQLKWRKGMKSVSGEYFSDQSRLTYNFDSLDNLEKIMAENFLVPTRQDKIRNVVSMANKGIIPNYASLSIFKELLRTLEKKNIRLNKRSERGYASANVINDVLDSGEIGIPRKRNIKNSYILKHPLITLLHESGHLLGGFYGNTANTLIKERGANTFARDFLQNRGAKKEIIDTYIEFAKRQYSTYTGPNANPFLSSGLIPSFARGERYISSRNSPINVRGLLDELSREERRALIKVMEGASTADIASEMNLSVSGASTLIENAKKSYATKYNLAKAGKLASGGLIPNYNSGFRAAAIKYKGKVFTGNLHYEAFEKVIKQYPEIGAKFLKDRDIVGTKPYAGLPTGYITRDGGFISTEQAKNYGIRTSVDIGGDEGYLSKGLVPNYANYMFPGPSKAARIKQRDIAMGRMSTIFDSTLEKAKSFVGQENVSKILQGNLEGLDMLARDLTKKTLFPNFPRITLNRFGVSNSMFDVLFDGFNTKGLQGFVKELKSRTSFGEFDSHGLVPNFSALSDAIKREASAGVHLSQIKIGQSPSLKAFQNPLGLGVYNTRDEPGGLNQGINRAIRENVNPKFYGTPKAFGGKVPNFAPLYEYNAPYGGEAGQRSPFKDPYASSRKPVPTPLPPAAATELSARIKEYKAQIQKGIITQGDVNRAITSLRQPVTLAGQTYTLSSDTIKQVNTQLTQSVKAYVRTTTPPKSPIVPVSPALPPPPLFIPPSPIPPKPPGLYAKGDAFFKRPEVQNKLLFGSFLLPTLAGPIAEGIGTQTPGQRGAGQTVTSLANVGSYAALGASFGGLPGVIGGLGIGAILEAPRIITAFTSKIPDLEREIEKLTEKIELTNNGFGNIIQTNEKLAQYQRGELNLTPQQYGNLKISKNQQVEQLAALFPKYSTQIRQTTASGSLDDITKLTSQLAFENQSELRQQNIKKLSERLNSGLFSKKPTIEEIESYAILTTTQPSRNIDDQKSVFDRLVGNYRKNREQSLIERFKGLEDIDTLATQYKSTPRFVGSAAVPAPQFNPKLLDVTQNILKARTQMVEFFQEFGSLENIDFSQAIKQLKTANIDTLIQELPELVKRFGFKSVKEAALQPPQEPAINKDQSDLLKSYFNFKNSIDLFINKLEIISRINLENIERNFKIIESNIKTNSQIRAIETQPFRPFRALDIERQGELDVLRERKIATEQGLISGVRSKSQTSISKLISDVQNTIFNNIDSSNGNIRLPAYTEQFRSELTKLLPDISKNLADSVDLFSGNIFEGIDVPKQGPRYFNVNKQGQLGEEIFHPSSLYPIEPPTQLPSRAKMLKGFVPISTPLVEDRLEKADPIEFLNRIEKAKQSIYDKLKDVTLPADNPARQALIKLVDIYEKFGTGERANAELLKQELEKNQKDFDAAAKLLEDAARLNRSKLVQSYAESYYGLTSNLKETKNQIEQILLSVEDLNLPDYQALREGEFRNSKNRLGLARQRYNEGQINTDEYRTNLAAAAESDLQAHGTIQGKLLAETFKSSFVYNTRDFYGDLLKDTIELRDVMRSSFSSAFQSFTDGSKNASEAARAFGISIATNILNKVADIGFNSLVGGLFSAGQNIFSSYANSRVSTNNRGGLIKGFASGGIVTGGSGIRDDVPMMLNQGSYVLKKSAVNKYGIHKLRKFASGGGVNVNLLNEYRYSGSKENLTGAFAIDPRLSVIGQTDENNPQNILKFARESDFYSYQKTIENYRDAVKQFERAKNQRLIGAGISAVATIGGAAIGNAAQKKFGGDSGQIAEKISSATLNSAGGVGTAGYYNSNANYNVYYAGMQQANRQGYAFNNVNEYKAYLAGLNNARSQVNSYYANKSFQRDLNDPSSDFYQGKNLGGLIQRYAYGGSVDNVPALLTAGEVIINKDTVDRVGVPYLNRLNAGLIPPSRMAYGGLVGNDVSISTPIRQDGSDSSKQIVALLSESIKIQQGLLDIQDGRKNKVNSNNQTNNQNTENSNAINFAPVISITIQGNGQSSEQQNQSNENAPNSENLKAITEMIKNQTYNTMITELRPGGLLQNVKR